MELYWIIGAIWAVTHLVGRYRKNPWALPLVHLIVAVVDFVLWPVTLACWLFLKKENKK